MSKAQQLLQGLQSKDENQQLTAVIEMCQVGDLATCLSFNRLVLIICLDEFQQILTGAYHPVHAGHTHTEVLEWPLVIPGLHSIILLHGWLLVGGCSILKEYFTYF